MAITGRPNNSKPGSVIRGMAAAPGIPFPGLPILDHLKNRVNGQNDHIKMVILIIVIFPKVLLL
jgi:hypothetical protein